MDLPAETRSDDGQGVFQGTRIPVYLILEKLAAGETEQQIMSAYPESRGKHIKAAL